MLASRNNVANRKRRGSRCGFKIRFVVLAIRNDAARSLIIEDNPGFSLRENEGTVRRGEDQGQAVESDRQSPDSVTEDPIGRKMRRTKVSGEAIRTDVANQGKIYVAIHVRNTGVWSS
jgi:hypothetical protein